jgi:uncharacterized membrane protein
MDPYLQEILNLLARWIHVIAGIMWVGNSMLFNWLDRNLEKPADTEGGRKFGRIWLLHSGAYYNVEKLLLTPEQMPRVLHWFKWQSYITWLSGFVLLVVVYYAQGGTYLVDPTRSLITAKTAVHVGPMLLLGAWLVYDVLWRSPLGKMVVPATVISLALAAGATYGVCQIMNGRAAFMHIGAMLGTLMAGNVFFHIIPSQKQLVASTKTGGATDIDLSARAKRRSIHNNYLTFPVIFLMISNHFGGLYGGPLNWVVLLVLAAGGAGVRFFMNVRFTFRPWIPCLAATSVATLAALYALTAPEGTQTTKGTEVTAGPASNGVPYKVARAIVEARCTACHSAQPTIPALAAATQGVHFDTPEQMKQYAERMKFRTVTAKTMPFANMTGMPDEERALLGRWVDEGAPTE